MSKKPVLFFKYLPLCLFVFTIFSSDVSGQVVTIDVLLKQLNRGPFTFSDLVRTRRVIVSTEDREGCSVHVVRWTADRGKFRYVNDAGTVIEGNISGFSLDGKMSKPDSPCQPLLEIDTRKLNFKLVTVTPFNIPAYGGVISLPQGQETTISNIQAINITGRGRSNHSGTLAVTTTRKLNWRNAKFNFQQLPNPIILNAESGLGDIKEFEIPLNTGKSLITNAQFAYVLPHNLRTQPFELHTPNYRANLRGIGLGSFIISLTRNRLGLKITNLSGTGEIAARSARTPQIPILFNGRANVNNLSATANFSLSQADMKDITFNGLKLIPELPTQPNRIAIRNSTEPTRSRSAKVLSRQTSLENLVRYQSTSYNLFESETATTQTIPPVCFEATQNQLADIKSLGMNSLPERQRLAIRNSSLALKNITAPDFIANLPANDVKPLIQDVVLKVLRMKILETKFGKQEVLFCAELAGIPSDATLPPINLIYSVAPSIELRCDPKDVQAGSCSETNPADQIKKKPSLVFRYNVSQAGVESFDIPDDETPEGATERITDPVADADSKAKEQPSEFVLPLNLDFGQTINLNGSKEDPNTGDRYSIRATETRVQIVIPRDKSVILIDEKGVHVIGNLEVK